jgi:hypothetical protein
LSPVHSTAPRSIGIPLSILKEPRDGEAMTDRWWVVIDGCALLWQRAGSRGWSPQCNKDRRLGESLIESLYPGATVEFVPCAYVGRWDENWGHVLTADLIERSVEITIRKEPS